METVPALDLQAVLTQGLVARDRPRLSRYAPVGGEEIPCLHGGLPGRTREQEGGRSTRADRLLSAAMGILSGFTRLVTPVLTLGLTLEVTFEVTLSGHLGWLGIAVDAADDLFLELRDGHGLGNF